MARSITLQVPDELLQCSQRGAKAARRLLEEFLLERLSEAMSPLADNLPSTVQAALQTIEQLDDGTLEQIMREQLPPARQRVYSRLLAKQRQGALTPREQATLQTLGDEARLLTLKAAHAAMVLKWRGHGLPTPAAP